MINDFTGDYYFLSNFSSSPIHEEPKPGEIIEYPTVEHYFQAMKTKNLGLRKKIAAAVTPGQAKYMGRHLQLRPDWENIKLDVMASAIRGKFEWPELREKLLATGDEELEEGNTWHDNFWGNCHCKKCQSISGLNYLGAILMDERERIRAEGDK